MDLTGIRVVSWDVDGTLYEARSMRRILARSWIAAAATGAVLRTAREVLALAARRRRIERARRAGDPFPADPDAVAMRALEARWYGPAIAGAGPCAGVREVIDAFAARGLRQVVLSDFEPGYKLSALGLASCFEATFCGEALGALKPSPALFVAMAARLGVEASAVLHIGDRTDTDGEGARRAGARSLIRGRDFRDYRELSRALLARYRHAP